MKDFIIPLIFTFIFVVSYAHAQDNVGIGTTSPDESAILDLSATDKGVLIPRLTSAQRDLIASPATGLLIYNTTLSTFQYYNGAWTNVAVGEFNTLDDAYNQGGAGAGRTITVNTGAVELIGSNAADVTLEVTNSADGGSTLITNAGAGNALEITNSGTGSSFRVNDEVADTTPFLIDNDGNIAVGSTSVNSSAILDISSTTRGILIPRMTEAQRDAIGSPAAGLLVYNTDDNEFQYYNGGWNPIGSAGGGGTLDAAYNFGGSGAGRTINVDNGSVAFVGSDATNPSLNVTNSANGGGILIENTGSGNSLRINDEAADTTPFIVDDAGNVIIGAESINASAILEIVSTNKGFLPPRMTEAQRDGIGSPAQGLLIFNTTDNVFQYYNSGWMTVGIGGGGNTLEGAYNQGGAGAGRTVNVTSGPIEFIGTNAGSVTLNVESNAAGGTMSINDSGAGTAFTVNNASGPTAVFTNTGTGTSFRVNDQASDPSPFVIDANGNVGIGLPNPDETLQVQGTVRFGPNGTAIQNVIKETRNVSIDNIDANSSKIVNVTMTSTSLGTTSSVSLSPADDLPDGVIIAYARVLSGNEIRIKVFNVTGSLINVPDMNFFFTIVE